MFPGLALTLTVMSFGNLLNYGVPLSLKHLDKNRTYQCKIYLVDVLTV